MNRRVKSLFENYWPSLLTGPVLVLLSCYYFYGESYLASASNFFGMTLIWMCTMFALSGGSLWVRSVMLKRFQKIDDWLKRVFFTLVGYLSFAAVPTWVVFQLIEILPYTVLRVDERRFYTIWIIPIIITFLYATVYECMTYFSKWKEAIRETEQLEQLHLESQFRSLQSQLNPHFLFNSFNVLSSLIVENPARAENFVDELSNVYRYLLRSNEHELAAVGEEIRFIQSFFHLLKTRYDEGISLSLSVPTDCFERRIPALAFQILVENAVKHNEIAKDKPLRIAIEEKNGALLVRNNLQQKTTKVSSNQVGLSNLRQRYELLGVTGFKINQDAQFFEAVLPLI